ncbi:MAG TPA: DNA-protecting protein DprA [Thermopetrobacter sp.]|nr:DNA-protecting protein DprA [Thermopetrobacter sp.]
MIAPGVLLSDEQRRDWLRLSRSQNVGARLFFQLINRYGGAAEALAALPRLAARGGRKRIRIYPEQRAEADLEAAAAAGARFVARGEAGYPPLLRHTDDPPPLICIKGRAELAEMPLLAIVGARNASLAGLNMARRLAAEIGAEGYGIVSGLARGIDTAAHEAALDTGTIAVLAGGIDHVYPRENARLMQAIGERGLLITEMTPGTTPQAKHFPRRNRLVAGMSLGTLVVEAAVRSGSLITARLAGEFGREVFAVPGHPSDPRSGGVNRLIRHGACLVRHAEDVLRELPALAARTPPEARLFDETEPPPADVEPPADLHGRLLSLIGAQEADLDILIREVDTPAAVVVAALMELELAGQVARTANGGFARAG